MKVINSFYKIVAIFVLSAFVLFAFSCCGSEKENIQNESVTDSTAESTTEKKEESRVNLLTGLENLSLDAVGKRPVAVMINNIKQALPQYGVSAADIMFEILAEGGITRMMALYGDYTKVPAVCSVRSCRYYYPIFAHGFDAVYFCFGSNESLATPTLERIGIDYFDGNKNSDSLIFARDSERLQSYASEHTVYFKGENLPSIFEKYNLRSDLSEEKKDTAFNFAEKGKSASGDTVCDRVRLNFSSEYYSTFVFDSESNLYKKQHSGNAHIDYVTGEQLSYTNIFVLETDISLYENGPLLQVNWKGGGGYYISGGTSQKITWQKPTEERKITFYASDGSELKVNPGKSYIGVIDYGSTVIENTAQ